MKIYIRPSFITAFDECPFAADLQYNQKIKSSAISSNLIFGTAVHDAIGKSVLAKASNLSFDPVAQFLLKWDEAIENSTIHYNTTMKEADLRATGTILCEKFGDAWEATGFVPVVDDKGFLAERKLEVEILPGVILTGTPDVVAMNSDGEVFIIDFKTPATRSPELFMNVSDQLTAYQILVENNPSLGIPAIDRVGYIELLKKKVPTTSRGKGPVICSPVLSKTRRNQEQIDAFTKKVAWIVEDMKRGRYPKRPRMAFNNPCSLCEYKKLCHEGDSDGLIFPKKALNKAA